MIIKHLRYIALMLLSLVFISTTKAQSIYYVDGINGNNSNNGTSLASAWQTIQKACNSAIPNSIVQIKGGTYHENIIVNVSGTLNNPITFKNYMNDVVLIDGNGTNGITMLSITNKSYLNFENLTIQNLTKPDAQGILVETTGSTSATGLMFKNITITGINWTNNQSTIPSSTDNAQGFIAYGRNGGITNLILDSLHVYNNILGFSEAISFDGNINGFTVKNCTVHDNTNIGIVLAGNYAISSNSSTDQARHGIVSNNICYNNVSQYATSGGIYVDGGKNIIIEKNICYGNGNGIEIGCEENGTVDSIIVKNNLIYNNQEAGISVGGYTTSTTGQVINSTIRNNTLLKNNYSNDGTGELVVSKASNCVFENNIIYTNSQNILLYVDNISPQTNNTFNYNCWYTPSGSSTNITVTWRTSSYSTFNSYKNGTSQESNSLFTNPDLTNVSITTPDFHLLSNSSCINHGMPSTAISIGETDNEGNIRVGGGTIDIGALEFNSFTTQMGSLHTQQSEFNVYPNPFREKTTIKLTEVLTRGHLQVFDFYGKTVIDETNLNGNSIEVEKHDLGKGLYWFSIIENNSVIAAGKLIVE